MTRLLMLPDGSLYLTDTGEFDRDSRYAGHAAEPDTWLVPAALRREAERFYGVSQGWAHAEFTARDEAGAAYTATAIGYRGFKP